MRILLSQKNKLKKKKKKLFARVKTLKISIQNLRKMLFRLSRWPSKAIDRNTVEKDVLTAYAMLKESIFSLSRVMTLDKKCWITSCVLLVSRVITFEISIFFLYQW